MLLEDTALMVSFLCSETDAIQTRNNNEVKSAHQ